MRRGKRWGERRDLQVDTYVVPKEQHNSVVVPGRPLLSSFQLPKDTPFRELVRPGVVTPGVEDRRPRVVSGRDRTPRPLESGGNG